ncbi:MAG: Hsp20/alpha crystallin family protein [Bacteroidota bacterium]
MQTNRELSRNLARAADFINTVNGGTVAPTFHTAKEQSQYRIEVAMPTVDPDDLKVEINNGVLMIFHQMSINEVQIPNVLGIFKLERDAVLDEISAAYEEDLLIVRIPKNQMNGGFRRDIEIERPL